MPDGDSRQEMIDRYAHAEAVCRICRWFRLDVPHLPPIAERAAVALAMPLPELIDRLQQFEQETRSCR